MSLVLHKHLVTAVLQQNPLWEFYLVENSLEQPVWLMQLHPQFGDDAIAQKMVRDSFQEAIHLRHPHVLELLPVDQDEGGSFALYAPIQAVPLLSAVEKLPPDPATASAWTVQLCRALQHGHLHGVFHGCLSWPVLYVTDQGQIKVACFGLHKLFGHALALRPDDMLSFAMMASPRRLADPEQMSMADELYSVGVIYYHLLTGQPLFQAQTMPALLIEKGQPWQPHDVLSDQANRILGRLLDPDPAQQYANCRELINDLSRTDSVPENVPHTEKSRWERRYRQIADRIQIPAVASLVGNKKRIAFIASLILLLVFVGFMMTWISEMGQEDWRNQALYNAFVAEQDSLQQQKFTTSSTASTDRTGAAKSIALAKPMQSTKATPVVLSADSSGLLFAQLAIAPFIDTTLTAVDVYINNRLEGQSSGSTPFIVQGLAAGKTYEVRLQKQGYATWQQRCLVQADQENTLVARLQPLADAVRRFTFNRATFADRVSVDGKLPSSTLPCEMDLLMGSHELRYIDTVSGFQWSTRISLDMNSTRSIMFNGEQVGMGRLAIVLADPGRYGYAFVFMPGQSRTLTTPLKQRLAVGRYALRIFREGFHTLPSDTSIYIRPDQEMSIVVQMSPM